VNSGRFMQGFFIFTSRIGIGNNPASDVVVQPVMCHRRRPDGDAEPQIIRPDKPNRTRVDVPSKGFQFINNFDSAYLRAS